MEISDVEVAWLAGLLEGEGSFFMGTNHSGGKAYRYPTIQVNMTDRDVIERVASLFGSSVYCLPPVPDRRPAFRAHVSGRPAALWMERLRPWLGSRRGARVDEVVAEYGAIGSTEVRRRRACSEAAAARPRVNGRFVRR